MNKEETFICEHCNHELPVEYKHEEKPEVCFLDFISEKDEQIIKQAVEEAELLFGNPK